MNTLHAPSILHVVLTDSDPVLAREEYFGIARYIYRGAFKPSINSMPLTG